MRKYIAPAAWVAGLLALVIFMPTSSRFVDGMLTMIAGLWAGEILRDMMRDYSDWKLHRMLMKAQKTFDQHEADQLKIKRSSKGLGML